MTVSPLPSDGGESGHTPCTCIAEMDAKLGERNTRLCVTFGFPRDGAPSFIRPTIMTEKVVTRQRGSAVLAIPTFCPFCGQRYEAERP